MNIGYALSIVGIWPRFIEPQLVGTTQLTLEIEVFPKEIDGIKIVQFSDLHLHEACSDRFLKKVTRVINQADPDLIVFTGDFLCYSRLSGLEERLIHFLNSLKARFGCFAVLGNHDYAQPVSIDKQGVYNILEQKQTKHPFKRGFERLFHAPQMNGVFSPRVLEVPLHSELTALLKKTPFKLLHNQTELVKVRDGFLNVTGLGEYMLGRFLPKEAFKEYRPQYPGLILAHNPDTGPKLTQYPGDVILSGHTHGGQINLPWIVNRLTLLEHSHLKKGLWKLGNKALYINKGIGSVFKFRWFAKPEILILTLNGKKP